MTDWQLLQKFIDQNSQTAFAELSERYTNLVYRVCLRELENAALAEDAAQAVFLILARKAKTLTPNRQEVTLSSWLFQTALLTSKNVRRQEERRQAREQEAATMQAGHVNEPPGWADVEPLLNEALQALPFGQRTLILERFFQERPLAEIGAGQGISEDAARMRVNRALERLRRFFAARNVTLSAAALAAILPQAVRPAPAHAAEAIQRLSLAPPPTAANTSFQTIAQGAIHTMNLKRLRLQIGATALVAVFVLGTAGAVQVTTQMRARAIRAEQQQSQTQALAIMDQMYATYASMKSFKCDTLTQESNNGGQVASYEIERFHGTPLQRDKIHFERASLINDPELSGKAFVICDGSNFYVTSTENKGIADRYAKFPAYRGSPSDFGGLSMWGGAGITGMPGIFFGDKLGRITNLSEPEYSLGQPTTVDFSGVAYPVALDVVIAKMTYHTGTQGRDWKGAAETVVFYIGKQDHLLYQVIVTDPWSPTTTETSTETIRGMEINKQLNPAGFVFTPSSGSHEVQSVDNLFPSGRR